MHARLSGTLEYILRARGQGNVTKTEFSKNGKFIQGSKKHLFFTPDFTGISESTASK